MILSVDFGSTSFKAAVVDGRLRVRGFAARAVEQQFGRDGKAEIPVVTATTALREVIRTALASAGIRAARLRAIAVTSQAQTFTITDQKGRAKLPFISWQDTRASATVDELKRNAEMHVFGRHCSFGAMIPALQICQLRQLRKSHPRLIAQAGFVFHLPTYFIHQWTGVAAIDDNLAAMSGMYSLELRKWWPAALRLCGLRGAQLPLVLPVGSVTAVTSGAAKFGLPDGVPVVLAGNDQTAGAFAAKLENNNALLVTLGTAQAAYVHMAKLPKARAEWIRGPYPAGGCYRMAADGYGGNLINWAKTILNGCATDEEFFNRASKSPAGCNGAVFEPNDKPTGNSWGNLASHHTSADLARAVLEGLTRRTVRLVRRIEPRLKRQILVAGGGSENPLWVRMLSEQLGVRCRVIPANPCLGAARMALRALRKTRQ
jgi:sugar (pentulose or hexulose) kinase